MALSNIFREPRREITESLVGIAVVAVPLGLAWWFGEWLNEITSSYEEGAMPVFLGFIVGCLLEFVTFLLVTGFLELTHAIGDAICDTLERRNIHLRPRVRR